MYMQLCMCIEVSGVFIDVTFKCYAKFFLQLYTIWTICCFCVIFLPGKSGIIYRSMWSAIRSLCERHNSTLEPTTVHINFEVAMHTVLENAQCTFKNEL